MNEKEFIELVREVKEKAPNEFIETIGFMKGIKSMVEKYERLKKQKSTLNES